MGVVFDPILGELRTSDSGGSSFNYHIPDTQPLYFGADASNDFFITSNVAELGTNAILIDGPNGDVGYTRSIYTSGPLYLGGNAGSTGGGTFNGNLHIDGNGGIQILTDTGGANFLLQIAADGGGFILEAQGNTPSSGDITAFIVDANAPNHAVLFLVDNNATSSTGNEVGFTLRANNSASSLKFLMQFSSSFNDNTAGSETSYIALDGFNSGSFQAFLEFYGNGAYFHGPVNPNSNGNWDLGNQSQQWRTLYIQTVKFETNTTGSGTPLFGTNSPASTLTHPYTWITAKAADGTTIYIPAWA